MKFAFAFTISQGSKRILSLDIPPHPSRTIYPNDQLKQYQLCRNHHEALEEQGKLKALPNPKENPQNIGQEEDETDKDGKTSGAA